MSEERKFLHDISSPITSLQLDIENALAILEENPSTDDISDCRGLLKNSLSQVKKTVTLIRARRDILIREGEA